MMFGTLDGLITAVVGGGGHDPSFSQVVLLLGFNGTNLLTGSGSATGGTLTPSGTFAGAFAEDSTTGNHQVYYQTTTAVINTPQSASVYLARGSGTNNRFVRFHVVDNPAGILHGFYTNVDLQGGTVGVPTAYGDGVPLEADLVPAPGGYIVSLAGIVSVGTSFTPYVLISACSAVNIFNYAGSNSQCFTFNQTAALMATGSPGMTDESSHAHGTGTALSDATVSAAVPRFGFSSFCSTRNNTGKAAITFPTSSDWNIGSDQFTIECFVYITHLDGGTTFQPIIRGPSDNWYLSFSGTQLTFFYTNGTTPIAISDPNVFGTFAWFYVCIDFDGTKYRLYNNVGPPAGGSLPQPTVTMVASSTTLETFTSAATVLTIGNNNATLGNVPLVGFVDELRFTRGVARYATDSGFTVPTAPFPRS